MSQPTCEVKTHVGCNGQAVRRVKGPKKTDPEFWCCLGCRAVLSRQGVKVKDVPTVAGDKKRLGR
jgi:hypothetical protein